MTVHPSRPSGLRALTDLLAEAGFVAAAEEAEELLQRAGGDGGLLDALVARRLTGEPLAWITGTVTFCGLEIRVDPGVYVPRPQSQALARRAAELLGPHGTAVDLCTGAGAVAATISAAHPRARVVGSDLDGRAVACARTNGVDASLGDLFAPLPTTLRGGVDVIVGVVPYVPTGALSLLQRDTLSFESARSYDGGGDGADVLRRVLVGAPTFLRAGGVLLLELGGDQAELLQPDLGRAGFADTRALLDEDGDVRGIESTLTR